VTTGSIETEDQYRAEVYESLKNWRIDNVVSNRIEESAVTWSVEREREPQFSKRDNVNTISIPAPEWVKCSPAHVTVTGNPLENMSADAGKRLLRMIGENAAFQEHGIIVEALAREGTQVSAKKFSEVEIVSAIQKLHAAPVGIVILMSLPTKADLTLSGKLVPEWETKPKEVESKWFAGNLFGYDAYWSPKVEDDNCFVLTRDSVGIRRSLKITFDGFQRTSLGTRFDSVELYEDMLCWCINPRSVLFLKLSYFG